MATIPLSLNKSLDTSDYSRGVALHQNLLFLLTSRASDGPGEPFEVLSTILPLKNASAKFWWNVTGSVLAKMLKHALYPIPQQYHYLIFYHWIILPELGVGPFHALSVDENFPQFLPVTRMDAYPGKHSEQLSDRKPKIARLANFKSYMTDDHSPIELSWQFNKEERITRFTIDPVRRQMVHNPRGAIGFFEDLGHSCLLAEDLDLEWCRICANSLTSTTVTSQRAFGSPIPEYPTQYCAGFDLSSHGMVIKAYFLPETRAAVTLTSKSALITACITELSSTTSSSPNSPDLLTPWKLILSFIFSLPASHRLDFPIVAVDCVPSVRNRVKIYARTQQLTLMNIRRFFTLGREPRDTSQATQLALEQVTILWHLLFPDFRSDDYEDVEPHCPRHPTDGIMLYYELRPGYAEPFPKVYLPVHHWCNSDEQIVSVMETFYKRIGNIQAAERYGRDVRETYTHRSLSSRAGVQTYIGLAAKSNDVEVTSYFNPECYAPERWS